MAFKKLIKAAVTKEDTFSKAESVYNQIKQIEAGIKNLLKDSTISEGQKYSSLNSIANKLTNIALSINTWNKKSSKNIKANWNDVTVNELRNTLQNCLDVLEGVKGDTKCNVQPNTYGLSSPYVSIASKGFISLNDPIRDSYNSDEEEGFEEDASLKSASKKIKSSLEDKIYNIADVISEEMDGYVSNSYSIDEYEEGKTWSVSFSLDEYEDSSFSDYGFEEEDMQDIINNIKNKYKKFDIEIAEFGDDEIDLYISVNNSASDSN